MFLAWCESKKGRKGKEGRRRGGALHKCPKKLGCDMKNSSSSHRSDSSDPIDKIGVRAYLYSGGEEIDSGVVMNYNSRYAWKWLYGNGDFAETYHTFEEPPYYWHPHTGDSG